MATKSAYSRPQIGLHRIIAVLIVAAGHAMVAIFHQYVLKDGTIYRMTRLGG